MQLHSLNLKTFSSQLHKLDHNFYKPINAPKESRGPANWPQWKMKTHTSSLDSQATQMLLSSIILSCAQSSLKLYKWEATCQEAADRLCSQSDADTRFWWKMVLNMLQVVWPFCCLPAVSPSTNNDHVKHGYVCTLMIKTCSTGFPILFFTTSTSGLLHIWQCLNTSRSVAAPGAKLYLV